MSIIMLKFEHQIEQASSYTIRTDCYVYNSNEQIIGRMVAISFLLNLILSAYSL